MQKIKLPTRLSKWGLFIGGILLASSIWAESTYGPVKNNDVISQIASQYYGKESGVSYSQGMVAILRANPDAFRRGNVNFLKLGAMLVIPSSRLARTVTNDDANETLLRHKIHANEGRLSVLYNPPLLERNQTNQEKKTAVEFNRHSLNDDFDKIAQALLNDEVYKEEAVQLSAPHKNEKNTVLLKETKNSVNNEKRREQSKRDSIRLVNTLEQTKEGVDSIRIVKANLKEKIVDSVNLTKDKEKQATLLVNPSDGIENNRQLLIELKNKEQLDEEVIKEKNFTVKQANLVKELERKKNKKDEYLKQLESRIDHLERLLEKKQAFNVSRKGASNDSQPKKDNVKANINLNEANLGVQEKEKVSPKVAKTTQALDEPLDTKDQNKLAPQSFDDQLSYAKHWFISYIDWFLGILFVLLLVLFFIIKRREKIKNDQLANQILAGSIKKERSNKEQAVTIFNESAIRDEKKNNKQYYDATIKLDMAQAYLDLGNKESAIGVLQEVMMEGSLDQQKAAKHLLSQL